MLQGQNDTKLNEMEKFKVFLKMPITKDFVDILTLKTKIVLDSTSSIKRPITPPLTPLCPGNSPLPKLSTFVRNLIIRSRVQPATLFGTMVYLERLKSKFQNIIAKHECAPHRIMLAALIVAGKFLNDSSPKNKHWANYSQIFHICDINLMEKQMLEYLHFNLIVTEEELMKQYNSFSHLPHSPRELAIITSIPFTPSTPKSGIFPPSHKTPFSIHFPEILDTTTGKYHKKELLTPIVLSNIKEGSILPTPDSKGNRKYNPYPKAIITKLNHPSKGSTLYQRRASRKKLSNELTQQTSFKTNPEIILTVPNTNINNPPLSAPLFKQFPYPTYSLKQTTPNYMATGQNCLTLPPLSSIMEQSLSLNLSYSTNLFPRSG
ncbi:hypothetical protein K502DRAFT_325313 [Neoconidiobolus thromboides FSU 785]|nr:hypothetical protein K502DRAFT_325313 [Neoconidiobolus thromboides FSU 785]